MTEYGIYRNQLSFERDFTQIPNAWIRDKRISFKAKGLLIYLMSHEHGYALTFKQICAETREGESAIRSAVKELIQAGYLTTEPTKNERGFTSGLAYYISDPFEPECENPNLENPNLENRSAYKNTINLKKTINKEITRPHKIPSNFSITEELREWAANKHPGVNLEIETLNFIDYWETKPSNNTKLDWYRAWQMWIRKAKPESTKRQTKTTNWNELEQWAIEEDKRRNSQ